MEGGSDGDGDGDDGEGEEGGPRTPDSERGREECSTGLFLTLLAHILMQQAPRDSEHRGCIH